MSDIGARTSDGTVTFSWEDPGLDTGDTYQITTTGGDSFIQRTPSYVVDAGDSDRICITVAVNRNGKTGPPSAEKCADVAS